MKQLLKSPFLTAVVIFYALLGANYASAEEPSPGKEIALVEARELAPGLFILKGAVNTGVLVEGTHALLIDCCDTVTPSRLDALGVREVEMILCTQHRRSNVAGAYAFVAGGGGVIAPEAE